MKSKHHGFRDNSPHIEREREREGEREISLRNWHAISWIFLQQYSPTSIIMPSSSSSPFSLSLHHHHHYPLITSTTSSTHHSFITYHQLHIPKPKRGKAEEEEEEEEGKGRFSLLRKINQLPFHLEISLL